MDSQGLLSRGNAGQVAKLLYLISQPSAEDCAQCSSLDTLLAGLDANTTNMSYEIRSLRQDKCRSYFMQNHVSPVTVSRNRQVFALYTLMLYVYVNMLPKTE